MNEQSRQLIDEAKARKLTGEEFIQFLKNSNGVRIEETAQWAADTKRLLEASIISHDWEQLDMVAARMGTRLPEDLSEEAIQRAITAFITNGWTFEEPNESQ